MATETKAKLKKKSYDFESIVAQMTDRIKSESYNRLICVTSGTNDGVLDAGVLAGFTPSNGTPKKKKPNHKKVVFNSKSKASVTRG